MPASPSWRSRWSSPSPPAWSRPSERSTAPRPTVSITPCARRRSRTRACGSPSPTSSRATSGTDPLAGPRRTVDRGRGDDRPARHVALRRSTTRDRLADLHRGRRRRAAPGSPTTLVLRIQEGLDDHSTISTGRPPREADDVDGVHAIEVVVSTETAGIMQWNAGTSILVGATPDDPLFRGFDNLPDEFLVNVAGVAELDDVGDAYWSGDPRLHRPIVDDTGVGANFTVFTTIDEAQLPMLLSMLGGQSALRVEQRWDLDPSRIDMNNVDDVSTAVRATQATTSETAPFGSPAVTIELGEVLDLEAARRRRRTMPYGSRRSASPRRRSPRSSCSSRWERTAVANGGHRHARVERARWRWRWPPPRRLRWRQPSGSWPERASAPCSSAEQCRSADPLIAAFGAALAGDRCRPAVDRGRGSAATGRVAGSSRWTAPRRYSSWSSPWRRR